MLLSAVTTPVRASVQTGEPPNLAREGDPIGLTAEAGGFARPNHGLTTVVTGHGLRYPVEISENSLKILEFSAFFGRIDTRCPNLEERLSNRWQTIEQECD